MNPQNLKPFVKGHDPRRNVGGRPKAVLSHALLATMSDADAEDILKVVVAAAKKGDLQAVQMLWDRSEGKAIARQESGNPGDFTGLEDVPTADLIELMRKPA